MTAPPQTIKRAARAVVDRLPAGVQRRIWDRRLPRAQRGMIPPTRIAPTDNVAYNQFIWDWYADRWTDPTFRSEQLTYEGRTRSEVGDLERLGEEWGRLDAVVQVIDEWILPHVGPTSRVGEIGTGGGRVAVRVAPAVAAFDCFDVSARMLDLVRRELDELPTRTSYHHVTTPALPATLDATFDFLYSFDVFVHLDLHTQWRYVQSIAKALKPGAKAFLHTADLTKDAGWERFASQEHFRVEGFYFTTPEAVRTLAARAGLVVLEESAAVPGNFYYERDHLVLLQRPAG